jgi:hypothetical protein
LYFYWYNNGEINHIQTLENAFAPGVFCTVVTFGAPKNVLSINPVFSQAAELPAPNLKQKNKQIRTTPFIY